SVQLALDSKIVVQLTDAEREDGKTAPSQGREGGRRHSCSGRTPSGAGAPRPGRDEEDALNTIDKDEVWGGFQEDTEEEDHDAQENQIQEHNTEEDDAEEDDAEENSEKGAEVEEPPITTSSRVDCAKKITSCAPSDPDIQILDAAPKTAEQVLPKKKLTPRMSAHKETAANAMACERCASIGCTCYRSPMGLVCRDCKRLKAACSLVPAKGKGKQKSTPPANPTRTPTVTATSSSPNPRPTPVLRHSSAAKAGQARPAAAPIFRLKGGTKKCCLRWDCLVLQQSWQ
ncbi:hypothetical protein BDR05DRAFT_953987, partial [Suillus weaverae]